MEKLSLNSARPDRILGILAACGIVGPITYAIVLTVLGSLWSGYDPISQYMSELGAVDAPHAIVMNALGFQLLGIFMIGYGFGLHRGISKGWDSKIGVALIVISGVNMVLVGFFPCDPGCLNVSSTGIRHSITATISSLAMTFGMLVVSTRLRKDGRWRSYWVFTLAFAVVATFLSPLPMFPIFGPCAGLLQRLGMGLALFWMEVMSIKLLRLSI
jgi:hypothetical membrane protein